MTTISVRLNEQEAKIFEEYAKLNGVALSTLFKKTLEEKIELDFDLKEYWRYRVGNYRILADIDNDQIKVIIFNIGHRKDIYS